MPIHVGLEVPLHATNQFKLIQTQLTERFKTQKVKCEFAEPGCLSITLCFLGHVSEKSMEKLDILRSFASFYPKQQVIVNSLGGVPTWEGARGLWMSCRKTESITTLQEMVQKCIQRESLAAEMKNFFPRINICRFPEPTNFKDLRFGVAAFTAPIIIEATNIVVYESEIVNPDKVKVRKSFALS